MKKQKVYDSSLIDSVRKKSRDYKRYISPRADLDAYVHYAANQDADLKLNKPDSYNAWTHSRNMFYDWQSDRTATEKDAALGEYKYVQQDLNTIEGARDYIQAIRDITQYENAINQHPELSKDEQTFAVLNELRNIALKNKKAYEDLIKGDIKSKGAEDLMASSNVDYSTGQHKGVMYASAPLYSSASSVGLHENYRKQFDTQYNPSRFSKAVKDGDYNTQLDQLNKLIGDYDSKDVSNIHGIMNLAKERAAEYEESHNKWASKISDYYTRKKENLDFNFTDVDTYLYKVPGLLGSSASAYKKQIQATISGMLLGSMKGKGKVGAAAGLAYGVVEGNIAARRNESYAEVWQNYKDRVKTLAEKKNIDKKVLDEAKEEMRASGKYTIEQINNDDFVYDQLLQDNLRSSNVAFNQIMNKAQEGMESLYMDNMALSTSDVAQTILTFIPFGTLAKKALKAKKLGKLAKAVDKASQLKKNVSDRIDDVLEFGLEGIDKLPKITKRKALIDLGGRIALTSAMEGMEEGIQYIKGKRYTEGDFDTNPHIIKSFIKNIGTGGRALVAALTPFDPLYSSDKEFLENFKGGALLGGLMTGAMGAPMSRMQTKRQMQAQQFLADMYADKLDRQDRVRKDIMYGDMIRRGRFAYVDQAFDDIIGMGIEGIDTEDIEKERQYARKYYGLHESKFMQDLAKQAGIDHNTEDYDKYIALVNHHQARITDTKENSNKALTEFESVLNSKEVTDFIDRLIGSPSTEDYLRAALQNQGETIDLDAIGQEKKEALCRLIGLNAQIEVGLELLKDYEDAGEKLNELEKEQKIHTSRADVLTFKHILNKDLKRLKKLKASIILETAILGIKPESLDVPGVSTELKQKALSLTGATLENSRAEQELEILMNAAIPNGILHKINMFDGIEDKDNSFVQELNDMASGKHPNQDEDVIVDEPAASENTSKPDTKDTAVVEEKTTEKGTNVTEEPKTEEPKTEEKVQQTTETKPQPEQKEQQPEKKLSPTELLDQVTDTEENEDGIGIRVIKKGTRARNYYDAAKRLLTQLKPGTQHYDELTHAMFKLTNSVMLYDGTQRSVSKINDLTDELSGVISIIEDERSLEAEKQAEEASKAAKEKVEATTEKTDTTHTEEKTTAKEQTDIKDKTETAKEHIQDVDPTDKPETETVAPKKSQEEESQPNDEIDDEEGTTEEEGPTTLLDVLQGVSEQSEPESIETITKEEKVAPEASKQPLQAPERPNQPTQTTKPSLDLEDYAGLESTEASSINSRLDAYSHQINFWLTKKTQDENGMWVSNSMKYQGMEQYANNEEFAAISAKEDFIEEVTRNGVRFEVKQYDDGSGNVRPAIYAIFNYKGKEYIGALWEEGSLSKGSRNSNFNRMPFAQQENIKENLRSVRNKILELWEQVKDKPNLQIEAVGIHTTAGKVNNAVYENGAPKNRNLLKSKWLTVKDPKAITPENTRIGITEGPAGQRLVRFRDRIMHAKGTALGKLMWFFDVKKSDGKTQQIAVALNTMNFKGNHEIANLILNLITSNELSVKDINGANLSITPRQFLPLIVNFGNQTIVGDNADFKFTKQQHEAKLRKQFYIEEGTNDVIVGTNRFTISELKTDEAAQERFKQYVMENFHWNMDEDMVQRHYFGGDNIVESTNKILEAMYYHLKGNTIDRLTFVPGVLEFTADMFGLEKDSTGKWVPSETNPYGRSVLSWLIASGKILTNIEDDLYDANVYFDDVKVVDKNTERTSQEKIVEEEYDAKEDAIFDDGKEKADSGEWSLDLLFAEIDKSMQEEAEANEKYKNMTDEEREAYDEDDGPDMTLLQQQEDAINIKGARQWLIDKLGIDPEIVDSVIDINEAGQAVVGRCTVDSIILSEMSPRGTEYHEAWHRVSLLLISEKKRQTLYKRYKNKYGEMSDKAAEEGLAEMYRTVMLSTEDKKGIFGFDFESTNWFRRIFDFVRLWSKVGQYGIARMMYDISRAKYKGLKPNRQNVNRFRQIYKNVGPNFEVAGTKFNAITTRKQFDNAVDSLIYALLRPTDNVGLDFIALNKTKPDFKRLKDIIDFTAQKYPTPAYKEISENFESVFLPAIMVKLKRYSIRAFDKANEDVTELEHAAEGVNIGEHTVDSINTSIRDNAPGEVKFFFKTIPSLMRDEKGNITVKKDPTTGFPMFEDDVKVWLRVLKDLHGYRNIKHIMARVSQLSNSSLMYAAIYRRLNELVKLSLEKNKYGKPSKKAIDAEALLTKIQNVITCDINNFVTAAVNTNDAGNAEISITDNTVDMKAAKLPSVWSQALFYNSDLFQYDNKGNIVARPNAKKSLDKVQRNIKALINAFTQNKGLLKLPNREVDLHKPANQEAIKDWIVSNLNSIGIGIDKETINTMLESGDYGKPDADMYTKLDAFVTSKVNFGGMYKLLDIVERINKAINNDSTVKLVDTGTETVPVNMVYKEVGFIKTLANYFSQAHATDKSLGSLGPNGNSYYMVSQNSFVKDRIHELNNDSGVRKDLDSVVSNKHSLLLESARKGRRLTVETFINFKDNTSRDQGRDYFGITDREDYLAKMAAIFSDRIIFPTIADKKTYHFIRGVKLFHEPIQFSVREDGKIGAMYGDKALEQLIGYCKDELARVELAMRQTDDDPSHFKDGIHYNEDGTVNKDWLSPNRRIKNFHTPNKVTYTDKHGNKVTKTIEGNGSRFLFLSGVYVGDKFISFNNPKKSAKENLQTAKDYFFNAPLDVQKKLVSGILNKRIKGEINKAIDLGLIYRPVENDEIWSLRNMLLDEEQLQDRMDNYTGFDANNSEGYAIWEMFADYTINSIISIQEVEKMFNGDPAYYKVKYNENGIEDSSVDKIKRLGGINSTGINNRLDFLVDPLPDTYSVAELKDHEIMDHQYHEYEKLFIRGSIKEQIIKNYGIDEWNNVKDLSDAEIAKQYPDIVKYATMKAKADVSGYKGGINVADAAVYITPDTAKNLLRMRGLWSKEVKSAFSILTNEKTADSWQSDPELYAKANKVVLNAMKYVAFGMRFNEIPGLGIPYFNKMALFPLFKSIATGDMKALYDRMTNKSHTRGGIDMVMFESAVKVGSRNPKQAYKQVSDSEVKLGWNQTTLDSDTQHMLETGMLSDFNDLEVYHQKYSYLRQQMETNPHEAEDQMLGTQFVKVGLSNIIKDDIYGMPGNQSSGSEIINTIMNCINKLSNLAREELSNDLLDENGNVNTVKLAKLLYDDAVESNANDNILEALSIVDGDFNIPLDALSDNKWLESRFISLINKRIVDINMAGGAFIQRSAFGVEATQQRVVTESMIGLGRRLKSTNEKGSMDSIISINLFKHIIPNYNKLTFEQARQWLIDHKIIGYNADTNSIGYRIPTQSSASISALRFVDVLPEMMGDTIVLPEDFTAITGSDFDIDKLYVARYNYNNDGIIEYNDSTREGLTNTMLQNYIKILTTLDNTQQLKLSIDKATGDAKAILKHIKSLSQEGSSSVVEPFMDYMPSYQEEVKSKYTVGKAGIGPFALNNAHHVLTQIVGPKFKTYGISYVLDLNCNGIWDKKTELAETEGRVLDWLSAMINGFVDIAKDPWITELNVNAWTYNTVSFLLRSGFGAATFYYTSQPIMKEIASEVLKTKGKYGIDKTKTPSQLEKEAIDSILNKYDPDGSLRKEFDAISKDDKQINIHYKDIFRTKELENNLKLDRNSKEFNKSQIKAYYLYLLFKPYSDSLANLVKYSKVDTKKTGKSFVEQQNYYFGMQNLAEDSMFSDGEVRRFYNSTFVGQKTDNSILFGSSLFANKLIRNTDLFIEQLNKVLGMIGRVGLADNKLLQDIVSAIESQVKSQFFNRYIADNNIDIPGMFVGDYSMGKQLDRFKKLILSGDERYKHLLAEDGTIANDLLQYLIPNLNVEGRDYIDTSELLAADQVETNNLINYWRELIDDADPKISKFAKNLVIYAFLTSGDKNVMNSFFNYVPNSYRKEIGYTDFINKQLHDFTNGIGNVNMSDIFLNNWHNDKLVRPVEMFAGANNDKLMSIYLNEETTIPNIIFGMRLGQTKPAIKPATWVEVQDWDNGGKLKKFPVFPTYIKYNDKTSYKDSAWHVYQLIGYTKTKELNKYGRPTGLDVYTPIYGLVSKKGFRYKGHTVVEYGRNTMFKDNVENQWDYRQALENLEALADMVPVYEKEFFTPYISNFTPIQELPSYQNNNYMKAAQKGFYHFNEETDYYGMTDQEVDIYSETYNEETKSDRSDNNEIDTLATEAKPTTQTQSTEQTTVNVDVDTNENSILSNMYQTEFEMFDEDAGEYITFSSVEQAFHYNKAVFLNEFDIAEKILEETDPYKIKQMTSKKNLSVDEVAISSWDKYSYGFLRDIMIARFLQDPKALYELLLTGDAKITHQNKYGQEQDNGRFSSILTRIRDIFYGRFETEYHQRLHSIEGGIQKRVTVNDSIQSVRQQLHNIRVLLTIEQLDNYQSQLSDGDLVSLAIKNSESYKQTEAIARDWYYKENGGQETNLVNVLAAYYNHLVDTSFFFPNGQLSLEFNGKTEENNTEMNKQQETKSDAKSPVTIDHEGLAIMQLYNYANEEFKKVISELGMSEQRQLELSNNLMNLLRHNNVSTMEQAEELLRKFICNL